MDSIISHIYADNTGKISKLNDRELQSFHCCTSEGTICFFWLTVFDDTSSYRFFVEHSNSCFFEEYTVACDKDSHIESCEEELAEYKNENEIFDVIDRLKLKSKIIEDIYMALLLF